MVQDADSIEGLGGGTSSKTKHSTGGKSLVNSSGSQDGTGWCRKCRAPRVAGGKPDSEANLIWSPSFGNSHWWARSKLGYSYLSQKQLWSLCLGPKAEEPQSNFAFSSHSHFPKGLWRKGKPWRGRRVLKQVYLPIEVCRFWFCP